MPATVTGWPWIGLVYVRRQRVGVWRLQLRHMPQDERTIVNPIADPPPTGGIESEE